MIHKTIRCAIYTRKSSEEGLEQDFNSLHAQREACEAFIKSQKHEGWQMIKTHYDDGGFSGGSMNRPALQQLMRDIEAGHVDVIVVYKVDRLSRSLHDFAKMVEVFDKHKVSFVSVTQQFNTTSSMGRLTLNVLLSFAQFEREVTGERIRDKVAASKRKGMWMGGNIPLGYDVQDKKLIVNEVEAKTIRHIYQRYLDLRNVRLLRNELQQQGYCGKRRHNGKSDHFSRGAVYHLLSNPLYIGKIRFKDTIHDGLHEGLVDPEVWVQVQKGLLDNKAGRVQNYRRVEAGLFHGKLFDAETSESLIPMHTSKKGRRYRYYVSQSLNKGKDTATSSWRLPGPILEKAVYDIIRSILGDRDALLNALTAANLPLQSVSSILSSAHEVCQRQNQALDGFAQLVAVRADGIEVTLSLTPLLAQNNPDSDVTITRLTPMQMKRRGNEMRLVIRGNESAHQDSTLVRSIARAHVWAQEILSGKVAAMTDIATREKVSDSYVKKVMPLAFLAPDIVQAILAGKQPAHLTNQMLIRKLELPLDWQEQRANIGFTKP